MHALKLIFTTIFLIMILFACPASAANLTANEFSQLCNTTDSLSQITCNMYIAGYLDGLVNGANMNWNYPSGLSLSVITIKNTFFKFLSNHPAIGDLPADTVLTGALVNEGILKVKKKQTSIKKWFCEE